MGNVSKITCKGFNWENDLSKFNEDFIKNYNENSDDGYFLEVDIEHPKTLWGSHKDLPFFLERKKLENRGQRKICHSHKRFKTGTKSSINTKRCAQSN